MRFAQQYSESSLVISGLHSHNAREDLVVQLGQNVQILPQLVEQRPKSSQIQRAVVRPFLKSRQKAVKAPEICGFWKSWNMLEPWGS